MGPEEAVRKLKEQGAALRDFSLQIENGKRWSKDPEDLAKWLSRVLLLYGEFKESQAELLAALAKVVDFRLRILEQDGGEPQLALDAAAAADVTEFPHPPFEADFFRNWPS